MLSDWRFYALLSAFFAALTAIFGKIGVVGLNSNLATFIRTVVILVFSATIVSLSKAWKMPSEMDSKSVVFLILSGLATGASWLCYYRALQMGPASRVAPLDKLSVALTIVMAMVFLGEPASWKTILGGVLIILGSIVIAV
jgi:bacterial/archaeal transporter family protein